MNEHTARSAPMSAEVLRRAAGLMRERARVASSSPWGVAVVSGMGFAVHRGEHDTISLYSQRQDAEHIASWHPAVSLAVADLLDDTAETWEMQVGDNAFGRATYNIAIEYTRTKALAVARLYLGEPS